MMDRTAAAATTTATTSHSLELYALNHRGNGASDSGDDVGRREDDFSDDNDGGGDFAALGYAQQLEFQQGRDLAAEFQSYQLRQQEQERQLDTGAYPSSETISKEGKDPKAEKSQPKRWSSGTVYSRPSRTIQEVDDYDDSSATTPLKRTKQSASLVANGDNLVILATASLATQPLLLGVLAFVLAASLSLVSSLDHGVSFTSSNISSMLISSEGLSFSSQNSLVQSNNPITSAATIEIP